MLPVDVKESLLWAPSCAYVACLELTRVIPRAATTWKQKLKKAKLLGSSEVFLVKMGPGQV